jgi:phosphotransferase system HPr-like phosphotransfer protein
MKNLYIHLDNGRLVKQFVADINGLQGAFKLISGRVELDAKSILGIYSLDLSKPLLLSIEQNTEDNLKLLTKYIFR